MNLPIHHHVLVAARARTSGVSFAWTACVVVLVLTAVSAARADGRSSVETVAVANRPDDPSTKPSDPKDPYPPVRHKTIALAFSLPEEVKADVVRKALADLSTKDADCRIVFGPVKTTVHPKKVLVVIEAPAALDAKDVAKALKKGAASADLVGWTCFAYADTLQGSKLDAGMPGLTPRDLVLGMSSDLHWFEVGAGAAEFFVTPGRMSAAVIADRFHKLAQPFGVKDLGPVVEATIEWGIQASAATAAIDTAPIEEGAAKRIEKVIAKLPGVKAVKMDASARTLSVTVVLSDLVRSGPVLPLRNAPAPGAPAPDAPAAEASSTTPPRMLFDTNVIFDALEKEHITATNSKKEGEDAGPKKGG